MFYASPVKKTYTVRRAGGLLFELRYIYGPTACGKENGFRSNVMGRRGQTRRFHGISTSKTAVKNTRRTATWRFAVPTLSPLFVYETLRIYQRTWSAWKRLPFVTRLVRPLLNHARNGRNSRISQCRRYVCVTAASNPKRAHGWQRGRETTMINIRASW